MLQLHWGQGERVCVVEGEPGAVEGSVWSWMDLAGSQLGPTLQGTDRGPFRFASNVFYPLTSLKQKAVVSNISRASKWPDSPGRVGGLAHILPLAPEHRFWLLEPHGCVPSTIIPGIMCIFNCFASATPCLECHLHFPCLKKCRLSWKTV